MIDKVFKKEWADIISAHYSIEKFSLLGRKIAQLRDHSTVYPDKKEVFKTFELTEYQDIKVVILGQDPYHDGSADGLAFSASNNSVSCPPSLRLILKELERTYPDLAKDIHFGKLDPQDLSRWAEQGVFLLNTSLTVQKGKPGSHSIYWKNFTKSVIQAINNKQDIIWLLMGNEAKQYKPLITNPSHAIVETYHPAADVYAKQDLFYGSGAFKQVNGELEIRNKSKIIW